MNYNLLIKCCFNEIDKISKPKHEKYNSKIKYIVNKKCVFMKILYQLILIYYNK